MGFGLFGGNKADATIKVNYDGKKAESGLSGLKKTIGTVITAAVIKQMAGYTNQLAMLGAQAESVEKNFANFAMRNNSTVTEMMGKLKKATLGMVGDMELQQRAMQAMVAGVKFDDIVTSMEFVTKFASATGTSVSQKMMTTMTGLARGSAMFLDDIGIQVMGSKDVVNDAIAQMKEKMDQFTTSEEDANVKAKQLEIAMKNLRTEIGKKLLPAWSGLINVSNKFLKGISKQTPVDKLNKQIREQESFLTSLYMKWSEGPSVLDKVVDAIGGAKVATEEDFKSMVKTTEQRIALLKKQKKALEGSEKVDTTKFLKSRIKEQRRLQAEAYKKAKEEKDKADEKAHNEALKLAEKNAEKKREAEVRGLEKVRQATFGDSSQLQKEFEERIKIEKEVQKAILGEREFYFKEQFEQLERWNMQYDLTTEQHEALRTAITKEQSEERQRIATRERNVRINTANQTLGALTAIHGSLVTLIGESNEKGKAFARIQQGIAIAQAWINVYQAATQVYATQFGGVITKALAMGAAVATGAATVAKIQAQHFQQGGVGIGGISASRNRDDIPAMLGRGESVISAEQTAMHEDTLRAIQNNTANTARGMQSMKGGGIVNNYYGVSTEQLLATRVDTDRRRMIGRRL